METYHKIQTLFKRDLDGSLTGKKGKMIEGEWTTPELEYLADNQWEFTEKVDGTNIRIELIRMPNGVSAKYAGRTDNATIPPRLLEHLEATFPEYAPWRRDIQQPAYRERNSEIEKWMIDSNLDRVVLFGEGYGPKIQGGGKYREDHSFVLFDVKIGDWWLTRDNVNDVAEKLEIESVPLIGFGTLSDGIAVVKGDTRRRVQLWDEDEGVFNKRYIPGPMLSEWGNFEAEGIVARPVVPMFDRKGNRIITKIKAVDFR